MLFSVGHTVAYAEENWSRFRGPNGSGVAAGVDFPAVWTAKDYAWKVSLPGKGHSSPIAWGDKLFVTTADAETGELTLAAITAETGETLWTRQFASAPHSMHGANSYASSTPAADDERVYFTWASPQSLQVAAVGHDGKEVVWQRDLGPVDYKHGFGGSPIVVNDLVVVANDHSANGFVAAFDARTGEPRWRRERAEGVESYATPVVATGDGGETEIIVNSTAEGMSALSSADGSVLWQLPALFPARCVASPIVVGGLVVAGSGEGGNGKSFTAVKPASEPTVAFKLDKSIPQVPTPVAAYGLLFVWSDRGVVSCCDASTGAIHWTERVGGNYFGSPIVVGGKLIGTSSTGEVVVLAASEQYKLLGRNDLGEPTNATPAVQNGRMYLRTESSLACLPSLR